MICCLSLEQVTSHVGPVELMLQVLIHFVASKVSKIVMSKAKNLFS